MAGKKQRVLGIDLGTTYSSIAQLDDDGNPRAIVNVDDLLYVIASWGPCLD